jgi:hypothetical protein
MSTALTSLTARQLPCASVIRLVDGKAPAAPLQRWQHAGENLEPQIFFVAQAVGAALDHTDLVVEPLDVTTRFDMTKLTGWGHNHISTLLV